MTSAFNGFATLKRPEELYYKLMHDRRRMKLVPLDPYAAFDFFVTAEHMLDWIIPGKGNGPTAKRAALHKSSPVLRTVSQVANGSKHFTAESGHHQSVQNVVRSAYAEDGYTTDYFEEMLIAPLSDEKQKELGAPFLTTLDLADHALTFWAQYLSPAPPPDPFEGYEPTLLSDL